MHLSGERRCVRWASTNGAENQAARPQMRRQVRQGQTDFFVRGGFFCYSFVRLTKEKKKKSIGKDNLFAEYLIPLEAILWLH